MRVERLEKDVLLFVGDTYESVATAFLRNGDALLVDALANTADAQEMRRHLEDEVGARVRIVVSTHYMNDHMAGLRLFPGAQIVAQRYYLHTFLSQRDRSAEDDADFVPPAIVFGDTLTLDWGRHTLSLFHNPGHTISTIGIDAPDSDLLFTSDNVVGSIAYVSSSAPELIYGALDRLRRFRRGRIVPGHQGLLPAASPDRARFYLGRLEERVREARACGAPPEAVRRIGIEECVAPDVRPTAFERAWHAQNLERILERRLFTLPAAPARS